MNPSLPAILSLFKMELLRYKRISYAVRYPEEFSDSGKFPLLIFLHGAGTRGTDIRMVGEHPFFAETKRHQLQAVSVAPQCFEDSWFTIFEQLQDFVEFAIRQPYIDEDRVYLMGASMGGYAVWQLAMSRPELFAAIVPICGGGMYWNAERLKHMGIWAFHGSDDRTILCEESRKMVDTVNAQGGRAMLTICQGVGHNCWMDAFRNEELFSWMMQQKKEQVSARSAFDNVVEFG